jgi:carboxyl-terminal processing protease
MGYQNAGEVYVKKLIEGGPAKDSGVQPGDVIVAVDGEDVQGWTMSEIAMIIRGEKGTDVVITVERNGNESRRDITITRDEIYAPSISWEMLENDIALVTIDRFTEDSLTEFVYLWDQIASEIQSKNPKGIVIDLRGNGGGFLEGAVYIAGEFLPEGDVVLYVQDRERQQTSKKVDREGKFVDVPIYILVDEDTASASEIFAGALQDHERAPLVGVDTYGKGTAQDVMKPSSWGGASIHITTQKWLLPSKKWINTEDPVYPDIEERITIEEIRNGDDPQLDKAIEEMLQKI